MSTTRMALIRWASLMLGAFASLHESNVTKRPRLLVRRSVRRLSDGVHCQRSNELRKTLNMLKSCGKKNQKENKFSCRNIGIRVPSIRSVHRRLITHVSHLTKWP